MVAELMNKLNNDEIAILDKATNDFFDFGYTSYVCPRCGNVFEFSQKGTSFQIKCQTNGCLKMTSRGI